MILQFCIITTQKNKQMENKNFQFKTNINCSGCVAKVSPFLDGAEGLGQWEVDTMSRDKVLTVSSEGVTEQEIVEAVNKAGFKIEPLS